MHDPVSSDPSEREATSRGEGVRSFAPSILARLTFPVRPFDITTDHRRPPRDRTVRIASSSNKNAIRFTWHGPCVRGRE
jgi:hypothetical protein